MLANGIAVITSSYKLVVTGAIAHLLQQYAPLTSRARKTRPPPGNVSHPPQHLHSSSFIFTTNSLAFLLKVDWREVFV